MNFKKSVIVFLFILLAFTGCYQKAKPIQNIPNVEAIEYSSVEELPSQEEYSKLGNYEKIQVRLGIENIPIEDTEEYYKQYVSEFLENEGKSKLINFKMQQDKFSLIDGKNNKSPLNIKVFIDIEMDEENISKEDNKRNDLCLKLIEHMRKSVFYTMKVREEKIVIYNTNKEKIDGLMSDRTPKQEIFFVPQDDIEYAAQTTAFNFWKRHFTLNKFGVIEDTKELYVEYEIGDGFFGKSSDKIKQNTEKLNGISEEVKKYLLKDEAIIKCIEENDLKILTVSFYNTLIKDKYLTFNFEV